MWMARSLFWRLQKTRQEYFSDRVLYYASFAIQQQVTYAKEQLERALELEEKNGGKAEPKLVRWNYAVNRVYVVCVLNYIMDRKHPEKYRWDVVRMDRELKEPFSETLTDVYLEMPKFKLLLSECDTLYKKFLYVLNNIEIMARLPKELNEQIFQKLKSIVEIERMTPDERLEYELSADSNNEYREVSRDQGVRLNQPEAEIKKNGSMKLIEQILDKGNVREALNRVVANNGAAGMDGMTVEQLREYMNGNEEETRTKIR